VKKILLIVLVAGIAGCAADNQRHGYSMSWSCDGNLACERNMGAWNGNGTFDNETDCLAWETGFLNSFGYPYDSVSSCTAF